MSSNKVRMKQIAVADTHADGDNGQRAGGQGEEERTGRRASREMA